MNIHPSSLLNLRLLKEVLECKEVQLVKRGVDANWSYQENFNMSMGGFNPLRGNIYYSTHSCLDRWLKKGMTKDPRPFNDADDHLMEETMFLIHDFLHIWAYDQITDIMPELGFGRSPITPKNLEEFTFCHLLTEAVAVVGLDYWYLCTINLDKVLNIGTKFSTLTVSYRVEDENEYKKFTPDFQVQSPKFFEELSRFYCDGAFSGFSKDDIRRSPKIYNWLRHELNYGVNQRIYSRSWLNFMSAQPRKMQEHELESPVTCNKKWQISLMRELGRRLWDVVKNERRLEISKNYRHKIKWANVMTKKHPKKINFCFTNFNHFRNFNSEDVASWDLSESVQFQKWAYQFLAQFEYNKLDPELHQIRKDLFNKRDPELYKYFFKGQKKLPVHSLEPPDLFILG